MLIEFKFMLSEFIVVDGVNPSFSSYSAKDNQTGSHQDLQVQEVHQRRTTYNSGTTSRWKLMLTFMDIPPETWHDVAQSRLKRDTILRSIRGGTGRGRYKRYFSLRNQQQPEKEYSHQEESLGGFPQLKVWNVQSEVTIRRWWLICDIRIEVILIIPIATRNYLIISIMAPNRSS